MRKKIIAKIIYNKYPDIKPLKDGTYFVSFAKHYRCPKNMIGDNMCLAEWGSIVRWVDHYDDEIAYWAEIPDPVKEEE